MFNSLNNLTEYKKEECNIMNKIFKNKSKMVTMAIFSCIAISSANVLYAELTNSDGQAQIMINEQANTNVDEQANTNVDEQEDTNVDEQEDTNVDEQEDTNVDEQEDTNVDEQEDTNVDEQVYILDVQYIRWNDKDNDPYDTYHEGKNIKYAGEVLDLPNIGKEVKGKMITGVNIYSDDNCVIDKLLLKMSMGESVFKMPACNLGLGIAFK